MSTATTFEVTVPLVVTVEVLGNDLYSVEAAEIAHGFPGFFSEAEAAGGVWSPAEQVWACPNEGVMDAAWDFVKLRITEGWQ